MNRILKRADNIKQKLRTRMGIAITGALVLVIALTWNEFINESIKALAILLRIPGQTWLFRLFGAIIVTIICVIAITYFSRWGEQK